MINGPNFKRVWGSLIKSSISFVNGCKISGGQQLVPSVNGISRDARKLTYTPLGDEASNQRIKKKNDQWNKSYENKQVLFLTIDHVIINVS